MGRIVIWIVGLALLSIIYASAIYFEAGAIQSDLSDRSALALAKHDIPWATVSIRGRDAILEGVAPDIDSIEEAKETIRSVWGIRMVECQCQIARQLDQTSQNYSLPEVTKTQTEPDPEPVIIEENNKPDPEQQATSPKEEKVNPVHQCQNRIEKALKEHTIEFSSGSSTISQESFSLLEDLITITKDCPDSQIEVAGHTDNVGDSDKNITLSLDRAQAVLDHFQAAGVSAKRLKAIGYGSSSPISNNGTDEGRKNNRRIEFYISP